MKNNFENTITNYVNLEFLKIQNVRHGLNAINGVNLEVP